MCAANLVHVPIHFRPYPLDGALHLLAVDVDGYPAGAALCHRLMSGQRRPKLASHLRQLRENAVVQVDCVFHLP